MAGEKLYRANWVLQGHKGKTLQPGETIRLAPEEAEALGDVLSPVNEDAQGRTTGAGEAKPSTPSTGKAAKSREKAAEAQPKPQGKASVKAKPGQQEQGQTQGAGTQTESAAS